jgi:hypothetical protein
MIVKMLLVAMISTLPLGIIVARTAGVPLHQQRYDQAATSVINAIESDMDILPGGHNGTDAADVGYALNHPYYESCAGQWRNAAGQEIAPTNKMVAVYMSGCAIVGWNTSSSVLSPYDTALVLSSIPQHP